MNRANADVPTLAVVRGDVWPFAYDDDDSSRGMVVRSFLRD